MDFNRESIKKGIWTAMDFSSFLQRQRKKATFCHFNYDTKWLLELAYLVGMYQRLYNLSTGMQSPKESISTPTDNLVEFFAIFFAII